MKKFVYNFKLFAKKNILSIVMLVLLCPILGYSYSTFIFDTNSYRSNEMYIGKLLYSIKIDGVSTSTVEVGPMSEVEIILQVTSLNEVSSKYKVIYNETEGVTVVYATDDNEPAVGAITISKMSTILIINSTSETKTITFEVAGGYKTNDENDILIPSGYQAVTDTYFKYDYETMTLRVDGNRVTELSDDSYYLLTNYNCTNGETVTWKNYKKELIVSPMSEATKCNVDFEEKTEEEMFNYGTIADAHVNNITEGYYSSNGLRINGSYAFCAAPKANLISNFKVNGNYGCFNTSPIRSFSVNSFSNRERVNPNENSSNLAIVNQGLNSYTFTREIPSNYTTFFLIYSGYSIGTMHFIGSLKLLVNGSYYTLKQAVTNGYIKPIVIMYSGREENYYFPNISNIYDGGNTDNGHYAYAHIFFMTNTKITGVQFYSSASYVNDNEKDGFSVLITPIDKYRMTLNDY